MNKIREIDKKSRILNNYLTDELQMTNKQKSLVVALFGVVMVYGVSHITYELMYDDFKDLIDFGVFWITDGLEEENKKVINTEFSTLYTLNLKQEEVTEILRLAHNAFYNSDF